MLSADGERGVTRLFNGLKWLLTGSLRRQLIVGVAGVHAVMMSVFVFDLVERQKAMLFEQQVGHTRMQAESLAAAAGAWMLSRDYAGMAELIAVQQRSPDIRYAMLVDVRGVVLASSEPGRTGMRLVDAASLRMLQASELAWLNRVPGLTDAAAPIRVEGRVIGWARVAVSGQQTSAGLDKVVRDGLLYTLVAILIGALLAWLMAARLTRRLNRLRNTMDAVADGATQQRVAIGGIDEASALARDFNAMLDALAVRTIELTVARDAQAESEQRFQLAVRAANDGIWDWDVASDTVYFSPRWKAMIGYAEDEIGDGFDEWRTRVHPDDLVSVEARLAAYLRGETERYEVIFRFRHKAGHYLWALSRGTAVRDETGRPVRMVGTSSDITALKAAEAALYEEKELAEVTLASIGDAVATTDAEGRVTFLNPVAEQMTGWPLAEARGQPITQVMCLVHEETRAPVENPTESCRREKTVIAMANHTVLVSRDGREMAVEDSAAPIFSREGELRGVVMVFHDVTERRALSQEMAWQSAHDALTGLFNRKEFERRLTELLEHSRVDTRAHAMMYLDLDLFKIVNDTCGHKAGDELLRQLSGLMQLQIRHADVLARLGGDEFGILLADCPLPKATDIAEGIRNLVRDFRFSWEGRVFELGVSIGLVEVNADSGTVSDVLADADMACYAAKDKGRNRVQTHSATDAETQARRRELDAATGIRSALKEGRVILYAQEIRPIRDGVTHYEILMRVLDEQGEPQSPALIIPAAERYGLMGEVDRWVINRTFEMAAASASVPELSINLSGLSIGDEKFVTFVREALQRHRLDASRFCFEITETAAISQLGQAMHFIHEMKQLGFRFALDDFGSGMSSFAYLKNLPVDYLKIDGVFVRDIADDRIDRAFVEAIARIGHVMGKKLIAEFVENDAILRELEVIGVDYAQGYGIGRPQPFEQLLN